MSGFGLGIPALTLWYVRVWLGHTSLDPLSRTASLTVTLTLEEAPLEAGVEVEDSGEVVAEALEEAVEVVPC